MMTHQGSSEELVARYRSWATADLVQAISFELEEYTPEAIELMRRELQQRGVAAAEEQTIQEELMQQAQDEIISYAQSKAGVRGLLAVFVVIFATWSCYVVLVNLERLSRPVAPSLMVTSGLRALVAVCALIVTWWLISKRERAPIYAQSLLIAYGLVEVGSWLFFLWLSIRDPQLSGGTLTLIFLLWSYLAKSDRVQATYYLRRSLSVAEGSRELATSPDPAAAPRGWRRR